MRQVQTYKNFLSQEEWDKVFTDYIATPRWGWGHSSSIEEEATVDVRPMYWGMQLGEEEYFTDHIFNKIKEATGDNLRLHNVYAGGNTYGTSGDIHPDNWLDTGRTFLYYASPDVWNPMWGGKTIFYPEGMENEYYEFTPNQGLYFKSTIPHLGEATTKHFYGLRVCIAFKLVLI